MTLVVGIAGKIGSGKDAIADRLVQTHGFRKVRFADALKEEVLTRLPRTLRVLYAFNNETYSALVSEENRIRHMVYAEKPPGVRELLQEYGTEVRRADDDLYWVKKWLDEVRKSDQPVVAPDMRFPNELNAILTCGGWLWRVERPGTAQGTHVSETALDEYTFDNIIKNNGSLEDLYDRVDKLVKP